MEVISDSVKEESDMSDSDSDNISIQSSSDSDEVSPYMIKKIKNQTADQKISTENPIKMILDSEDVASTLDRINLSNGKFTMLAASMAKAMKAPLKDMPLSLSTESRRGQLHRSNLNEDIKQKFVESDKPPLIIHWDGKRMKNTTNKNIACRKEMIERLPVIVTGYNVEKLLGVLKLESGTGDVQALAINNILSEWKLGDELIGMCFDTTSVNTGIKKRVCVLLENLLKKKLLHFPCRHHIHEIIISGIFLEKFGPSTGPNIPLFESFQKEWKDLNKKIFQPLNKNEFNDFQKKLAIETISTIKIFLNSKSFPRNDYKEIADLCLVILGEKTTEVNFKVPGAYHQARWMAKIIYCFKLYLFRKQLKLSKKIEQSLESFCMFASLVYVKNWLVCPSPSNAARNDLELYKNIIQYQKVDNKISITAEKKNTQSLVVHRR